MLSRKRIPKFGSLPPIKKRKRKAKRARGRAYQTRTGFGAKHRIDYELVSAHAESTSGRMPGDERFKHECKNRNNKLDQFLGNRFWFHKVRVLLLN